MRDYLGYNIVKNFEEVKNFWLDSTKGIKPNKKQEPVVFIVVYPKKMEEY